MDAPCHIAGTLAGVYRHKLEQIPTELLAAQKEVEADDYHEQSIEQPAEDGGSEVHGVTTSTIAQIGAYGRGDPVGEGVRVERLAPESVGAAPHYLLQALFHDVRPT